MGSGHRFPATDYIDCSYHNTLVDRRSPESIITRDVIELGSSEASGIGRPGGEGLNFSSINEMVVLGGVRGEIERIATNEPLVRKKLISIVLDLV